MVNFSIKADLSGIEERLEERARLAENRLEEAVLSSCGEYVPYRTGELYFSGSAAGDGRVIWSAPHASECYYASRAFSKKRHPRATARWFEAAKAASLPSWENTVKEGI